MIRSFCALASVALLVPSSASAFCGFYVSGADGSLYANATMVVMMRSGNQTVLSMQNNYQGPPEDFAMVIPVPVVLSEDNVKTLPPEIFQHVDALAAPRLVEYWEQDPCYEPDYRRTAGGDMPLAAVDMAGTTEESSGDLGVTVEAEFQVAEYDIVILSAEDSTGLDTWLRRESYNIPEGAETVLRAYVEEGTKFFVAKVDSQRVSFENGQAALSPLRFHYDTPRFSLPVRLGLLNSNGTQDLIVHVLSPNTRFEVANYPNAFIPTNIVVSDEVRNNFASFYEALYQATIDAHQGAVITEYSWMAGSCDPCPTPSLDPNEIQLLGNDVIQVDVWSMVLTRLHYRYDAEGLGADLVFREAEGVIGGTGMPNREGVVSQDMQHGGSNSFQGRYIILNPWEGDLDCRSPNRGQWGGPPAGNAPAATSATNTALTGQAPQPITNLAAVVTGQVTTINVEGNAEPLELEGSSGGCASCEAGYGGAPWGSLAIVGFALAMIARRRLS